MISAQFTYISDIYCSHFVYILYSLNIFIIMSIIFCINFVYIPIFGAHSGRISCCSSFSHQKKPQPALVESLPNAIPSWHAYLLQTKSKQPLCDCLPLFMWRPMGHLAAHLLRQMIIIKVIYDLRSDCAYESIASTDESFSAIATKLASDCFQLLRHRRNGIAPWLYVFV